MKRKTLQERLLETSTNRAIFRWERSNYKAREVLKQKVKNVLEMEYAYFITFTIAPKHYHYDIKTYFRKVKEALSQTSLYIANEDYGEDNGRFHIHALASFPFQYDYTPNKHYVQDVWKYGAIRFEPIHTKNETAIMNYMYKLSAHATKRTAHRIIYSREKRLAYD